MLSLRYYDSLAQQASAGDNTSTARLLNLARYDERVIRVICHHKLVPSLIIALEDSAHSEAHKTQIIDVLRKVVFYDAEGGDLIWQSFVRLCAVLSVSQSVPLKASTAELIINISRVQPYRGMLFNYSESFRHLILTRDPFHERAVCGCLAYIFCDDYMGDAVSTMQYKTDVLNHVNNLFLRTFDFCAWRYSVRCLYLAGGFNEDKVDVDKTRDLAISMNRMVPEFSLYFLTTYFYATRRHTIRGIGADHTPKWVVRRRASFGALFCALLGVYSGTFHDWRMDKAREGFNEQRNRERRKRKGFAHSKKKYVAKKEFDTIDAVTQSIFWKQTRMYLFTGAWLFASQYPLQVWRRPGWAKNVTFHFPNLPIFFPIPMGVPAPFNRVVPFVVVPFFTVKFVQCWALTPVSSHDYFVRFRQWLSS